MNIDTPLLETPPSRRASAAIIAFAVLLAIAGGLSNARLRRATPAVDTAAYRAEWDTWRGARAEAAVAPGRPLSYTGLTWLKPGANAIGSALANAVRLPGHDVPANVGVLIRDGDSVRLEPAPGVVVRVDSTAVTATVALRTDAERNPTRVSIGSAGFRIVKRVDSIGVRAWDAKRSALERFPGITHFALDPRWRLGGHFVPLRTPRRVAVMTESGVPEEHDIVGTVETTIDRRPYALTAFRGGRGSVFITFADESSGEETYGFRFLQAKLDTTSRAVVLDFNFAYNPDCAFSPFTTCPLPPPENRIRARLLAGERKLAYDRGGR